jgi:hypothetical protein
MFILSYKKFGHYRVKAEKRFSFVFLGFVFWQGVAIHGVLTTCDVLGKMQKELAMTCFTPAICNILYT